MASWTEKVKSTNYVLASTLLHSSAILVIAMAPKYFPEMLGQNDPGVERVEFTVSDSNTTIPQINPPPPPVPPTEKVIAAAPPVVAKKVRAEDKAAPKISKALPDKSTDIVAPTVVAPEVMTAEDSPVVVEAPAPVDEEKIKLAEKLAEAEALKVKQEEELALLKAKYQDELQKSQEASRLEAEAAQAELVKAEAARLAAEEEAKKQAAAAAAALAEAESAAKAKADAEAVAKAQADAAAKAQAEAAAAKANTGSGNTAENSIVKQDYLQLRQRPGNVPPEYDRDMRLKKLEGRGQLIYFVTKDGLVTDLRLTKSTGHAELDSAAVDAFKKYKFVPGQEGRTVHNFEFNLKGPAESDRGRLRTSYR